jgi:hypothetical protein
MMAVKYATRRGAAWHATTWLALPMQYAILVIHTILTDDSLEAQKVDSTSEMENTVSLSLQTEEVSKM